MIEVQQKDVARNRLGRVCNYRSRVGTLAGSWAPPVVTLEGEVECAVLECLLSTLSRLIWGLVTASSLGLTDDLRADMRWLPLIDRVFVQRSQPFWDF